jgi:putative component of toxin-antitoxin plasmid stabilization module
MAIRLIQIPGVTNHHQIIWQVRVLEIDGRNLVLGPLAEWSKNSPSDFKKIMKVLSIIGQVDRVRDEKKVKKSTNPKHDGVYEIRADKGSARLMFFYCEKTRSTIICTNTYWKTKSSRKEQDQAFDLCHKLKKIYEQQS